MKKILNKIENLNLFLKLVIIFFISVIVSFMITNYSIITKVDNKKLINVTENMIEYEGFDYKNNKFISTSDTAKIRIVVGNLYVNKIKFNYKYDSKFSYSYDMVRENVYGNPESIHSNQGLIKQIDLASMNIKSTISEITLNFSGDNFEITNLQIDNRISFNIYIFISTLIFINCLFLIIFERKKIFKKIENKFLLIGLSLGLLLIINIPIFPGISFDEHIHFSNVYKLSEANEIKYTESVSEMSDPFSVGFWNLDTIEERNELNKYFNDNHDYKETKAISSTYKLSYNNIVYLPMTMTYKICNLLNVPFIFTFMLGKFINLLVYLIPVYFAIKIIPIGKRILFGIALMPTPLFIASTYSYDATINSFLFLAISIFVYEYINKNKKLSLKNSILFIFSTLFGVFPKAVYIPIILLPLILPNSKFDSKNRAIKFKIGLVLIFLAVMSTFILPTVTNPSNSGDVRGGNTSVSQQLSLIKNQPLSFAKVFKDNAIDTMTEKFFGTATLYTYAYGGNIQETNTNINMLLFVILIFILFTDTYNQKKSIDKKLRIAMMFILCMIIGMIWVALYLSFTPVGSSTINGVQGRYFIPLLFPLLLCINSNKIKNEIKEESYDLIISLSVLLLVFYSIYLMIINLYCF